MRKMVYAVLIGAGLAGATAANAQDWGRSYEGRGSYYGQGDGDDGNVGGVCSGRRAQMLERWLDREADEGSIDSYRAGRIHAAIDRLEAKARHECREGDWRDAREISERYDRIAQWLRSSGDRRWGDRW